MKDTIFYIITSPSCEKVYIGSTKLLLCQRKANHYCDYRKYKEGKMHYCTSFELLKYQDAEFSVLKMEKVETDQERFKIEGELIKNCTNAINKQIAGQTKQEWKKNYRKKNIETITALTLCECGGKYQWNNKARHLKSKRHINFN